MEGLLATTDWVIIAAYFVLVFGTAFWATIKEEATRETSAGYFLANRNIGWFIIGASLFASNIGSEHLVGLAGTGADRGVAVGQFEVLAAPILMLLGWLFVPFYVRSGVFTMPEFLERRYSPASRWYLAVISVIGYVLTKISVTIAAGGIVFESLMGIGFWTGAIIVVIATGIYTVFGGLRAVLYTDLLQMFVLIGGAVLVTVLGLYHLGGWGELRATLPDSYFDMWLPMSDPDFPWTGILFGAPILGVWYWCTDQFIVQRVLSANGIDQSRRGSLFGALLKVLPLFIFVLPGVIAAALAKQGELSLAQPDEALPTMIGVLLPLGLRGIVVASLLAALMSSLSSVFNSCSTVITWDLYRKWRPEASEKHLVRVGQSATVVLVICGLLWIPLMANISDELYKYLQSVQAYISPPIAAVFLLGVTMKRLNARGAIISLLAGFVLGMTRLAAELGSSRLDGFLLWYASVNFLHYAVGLFVVCSVILVIVSYVTQEPDRDQLAGLTFATADEGSGVDIAPSNPRWRHKDIGLSILIAVLVAAIWLYFNG
jgi:SSS family solute:Na+ symporter